jgi:RNA polymerase sigma factor (sigma-70 family)
MLRNLLKDQSYWHLLWNRFRKDDAKAFREIYEEFSDALFAYGCKFSCDRELVKDCIHDLFVDLYRYKPNLNKPEYLEFYLFKSLKRLIISKLKAEKRITVEEEKLFRHMKFNLEDELLQNEMDASQIQWLHKALQKIEPKKREMLFLRFYSNLNYAEIAEIMNMNTDAVKKQIYRTLEYLRNCYGPALSEIFKI